jgi:pyruvate dehydrogenase E2 component (dihydrolipoyllysine-residue acetyltransferase)
MATGTAVDVVMPQMGVSVSEGTITKWLKSEGEEIDADEALLEISTDKVDTEIPSPASGVIRQILAQEGDTVAVGTKIAVIAPEGAPSGAPAEAPEPATQEAADEAAAASGAEGETPTTEKVEEEPQPAPAPAPEPEPVAQAVQPAQTQPQPQAEAEADGDGRPEGKFI